MCSTRRRMRRNAPAAVQVADDAQPHLRPRAHQPRQRRRGEAEIGIVRPRAGAIDDHARRPPAGRRARRGSRAASRSVSLSSAFSTTATSATPAARMASARPGVEAMAAAVRSIACAVQPHAVEQVFLLAPPAVRRGCCSAGYSASSKIRSSTSQRGRHAERFQPRRSAPAPPAWPARDTRWPAWPALAALTGKRASRASRPRGTARRAG